MKDNVRIEDATFNYTLELYESQKKFSNEQIASIVSEFVSLVYLVDSQNIFKIALNLCNKWDSEA